MAPKRLSIQSSWVPFRWNGYIVSSKQGILVGCDRNQECLLRWWWENYSAHNSYPVAFVDFGMSREALAWCAERGAIIALPEDVCPLRPLSPEEKERLAPHFGKEPWLYRGALFKKAFACLRSPFALSCWIDLDCEIRGSLAPLFAQKGEIALVKEPEIAQEGYGRDGFLLLGEVIYNSGVIAFQQGSPILKRWGELSLEKNNLFITDQEVLSRAIHTSRPRLVELPAIYNWKRSQGLNDDALILHYASGYWKRKLVSSFLKVLG